MSDDTLSLQEALSELSMTEAQIRAAVQAGKLRQIPGEDPPRFLRQDVEKFKKQIQSDATVAFEETTNDSSHLDLGAAGGRDEEGDPNEITEFSMEVDSEEPGSSRIDLAEVEAEPGADESDQTSVLPIGEEAQPEGEGEEPVFDFAEDDLGLADEEPSDANVPSEDSAAIALESEGEPESSADILEIASEIDEESSSDAMVAVQDDSDIENATLSDSDVVTDMLEADVEDSDDELDTIDLDEMDAPDSDTALEGRDDLMTVIDDETAGTSAETAPLDVGDVAGADEAETVSLDAGDMETEGLGTEVEMEPAAAGLEEEAAAGQPARPAARGYGVHPSMWANIVLALSVLLVAFGGFIMLSEAAGATTNPIVEFVRNFVNERFPAL